MRALLYRLFVVIAVALIPTSCASFKYTQKGNHDITPLDYGLKAAKTGEKRYYVLQRTHQEAERLGVGVNYAGIKEIQLTIPKNAKSLPITHYTNFAGVTFRVENKQKNLYLFAISAELKPVEVRGIDIDNGDFTRNDTLKAGTKLLVINDQTPWVEQRSGHDYGATRREVMLLKNGRSESRPVKSYCTASSNPAGQYCDVTGVKKTIFKNVTFNRNEGSTFKTYLVRISNHYDVELSGITINTPDSPGMYGDRAIRIENCVKIALENVTINGTYSRGDDGEYGKKYGYGISLENVYDFSARNLYARANWGIFGNNNVHLVHLEDCDINRFDIHCYGKDIYCKNVNFLGLYNQYASVYGTILYDKCTFTDFTPVLNGGSYNAYVEHEVVMNDCVMNITAKKNYLFKMSHLNEAANARNELSEKCLPNVKIKNMVVNMTGGADCFYLFYCTSSGKKVSDIGYLTDINIDGMTINTDGEKPVKVMQLSNIKIDTKQPVECKLKKITVNQPLTKTLLGNERPTMQLKANLSLKEGMASMSNVSGISQ